jgi:hypothetical protein
MSSAQAVEHLPQKHEALPDVKPQYYQKKKHLSPNAVFVAITGLELGNLIEFIYIHM